MAVKEYSLSKDGTKQLTEHFRVWEFRCHDNTDRILICQETVDILEAVRNYFGKPITITSGYRTPSHNKAVGGASGSQHVKGTAADFKVKDVPTWAVAGYLEDNYPKHGIGMYSTWVHLDARGKKVYWKDKGYNTVGTFGYQSNYKRYKAKEPEMTIEEIKKELLKDENFCIKCAEVYFDKLRKKAPSQWSEQARRWALSNGIFKDDSEWRSPMTREMAAQVMYNSKK